MSAPVSLEHATVLVTGATGFIGGHLVEALVQMKCDVHCLVRRTSDLRLIDRTRVQLHFGSLTDSFPLTDCLAASDYVFHCAGATRAKTRSDYFRINADACKSLYEQCARHGGNIRRIVHVSSLAAVGPALPGQPASEETPCKPLTYYGKSKLAGEKIAEQFSSPLPITILRPPVVYGPREVNFFAFLKGISKGWNLKMGSKKRALSLIYVKDLVEAMLTAAAAPAQDKNPYFITDGNIYPWDEVVQTASGLLNVRPRTLAIPDSLLIFAGLLSEFLSIYRKTPPLLDHQRMIDIRQSNWTASSAKFFNDFRFKPKYDLQAGLAETLDWYKNNRWL